MNNQSDRLLLAQIVTTVLIFGLAIAVFLTTKELPVWLATLVGGAALYWLPPRA